MRYELKTNILSGGMIEQELYRKPEDEASQRMARWLVETRGEGFKNALIELGWTPPEGING